MKATGLVVSLSVLLLLLGIGGCQSQNSTDNYPLSPEEAKSQTDSLDAQVEQLTAGERAPGEVIVRLRNEMPLEEAHAVFSEHDFRPGNVTKLEYVPWTYVLSFSEDTRDIKSVVKDLLLDPRVLDASANFAFDVADNESL